MITEFIEGESLRGFLEKYGGHFPSAEMFQATMEQVLGAIGYVHRLGHIHRDIAPDNVMVDRFAKPTVIDFGALKRDLRGSNAYSSIVVMREDYSPPEQQDPSLQQGSTPTCLRSPARCTARCPERRPCARRRARSAGPTRMCRSRRRRRLLVRPKSLPRSMRVAAAGAGASADGRGVRFAASMESLLWRWSDTQPGQSSRRGAYPRQRGRRHTDSGEGDGPGWRWHRRRCPR